MNVIECHEADQEDLVWAGQDCSWEVKNHQTPFRAAGVGATWYGDLKLDGPACILKISYISWSQAYEGWWCGHCGKQ